ncbi:MAG: MOSC domain-containing protein [Pseudomonadota bacterium]
MHQPLGPSMADLLARFPRAGKVEWIGVRPARHEKLQELQSAQITFKGLAGDHRSRPGKRAVTLIQAEHLPVIAALSGHDEIEPALLRRNIVVSGINLIALKQITIQVGTSHLRITGPCAPCSRMEEYLGEGGYNAMRSHGGVTAEVVAEGTCQVGDSVTAIAESTS